MRVFLCFSSGIDSNQSQAFWFVVTFVRAGINRFNQIIEINMLDREMNESVVDRENTKNEERGKITHTNTEYSYLYMFQQNCWSILKNKLMIIIRFMKDIQKIRKLRNNIALSNHLMWSHIQDAFVIVFSCVAVAVCIFASIYIYINTTLKYDICK